MKSLSEMHTDITWDDVYVGWGTW